MINISDALENLIDEFSKLPQIGRKTAQRLAMHVTRMPREEVEKFSRALIETKEKISFCSVCCNITEEDVCRICRSSSRRSNVICVVEEPQDVFAIEKANEFRGRYHVLHGIISPLDGIGPDQLNIGTLVHRIETEQTEELIFALSPNIQGDTTIYYIQKKISHLPCTVTTIARGIAFGGELEYADEMTLDRSLANRLPVHKYVK